MLRLVIILSVLAVAGCGGRAANPIATHKNFDHQLSCAHLSSEFDVNLKRIEGLIGENDIKTSNNVGLLLVSPLFLDLSDTLKVETEALIARNQEIKRLMSEKNCTASQP